MKIRAMPNSGVAWLTMDRDETNSAARPAVGPRARIPRWCCAALAR